MTNEAFPNPFTPTFGSIPSILAGREQMITDIMAGLENAPGDPNRSTIFVGPRGSGKTVLLASIAEQAEARGWICVNVTASSHMLEEILVQARDKAAHILPPETDTRLTSLQVKGLGFSREYVEHPSTWRSQLTEIVERLNASGTGLLITVDEVSSKHEDMRTLAEVYQHFIRERRDVALLLAGPPGNVSQILEDDDISFLRRAFRHWLGAIPLNEVELAMRATIEEGGRRIAAADLSCAAEATGGFAFLIQLIGYYLWQQHPYEEDISGDDVDEGIRFAQRQMDSMVFDATLRDLSQREVEFVEAMAVDDDESLLSDIAARMGITRNNASKLRARLVEQGVVGERRRGVVGLEIPMFRDYLRRRTR